MFASVCESTWLTINQQGNNNSDWILGDWFFWFVCSLFSLVGLITSVMRVSAFSWMLWRSTWTRSSEWSSMTSNHCAIFFFFLIVPRSVYAFTMSFSYVFCFSGRRILTNGTSINSSSAWKLSWTTRFVWASDDTQLIDHVLNSTSTEAWNGRACNYLALMLCLRSQVNDSVIDLLSREKKRLFPLISYSVISRFCYRFLINPGWPYVIQRKLPPWRCNYGKIH